jgi:hypothetical protein
MEYVIGPIAVHATEIGVSIIAQITTHLESGTSKFFNVSIQYFETVSEVSSFIESTRINLLTIPSVYEKYCMTRGNIFLPCGCLRQ